MDKVVFIDTEVSEESKKIYDYGAAADRSSGIHTSNKRLFVEFIRSYISSDRLYLCGHNIIHHDLKYLQKDTVLPGNESIDTLYLSPLLFPNKPYHALVKDDKLQTDELNNPLNDCLKAMELFYDEVAAFRKLDENMRQIFTDLLYSKKEFHGFFEYQKCYPKGNSADRIRRAFIGKICENADLENIILSYPVELAYALALISAEDHSSIVPHWVNRHYPMVNEVLRKLRGLPCRKSCPYCEKNLNIHARLKGIFGYEGFRAYDGENLQERATQAAVDNRSLLAIFPTGGGKSVTFQLPALIAGEASRALTVIISPLQSLMKDQVDNLEKRGIVDAVAISGLLSSVERAEAFERVESGLASILYISPESLRSNTMERLLMKRNIARFVIDEAHCFSAWGQDFRVDYLYIGDFIKNLEEKKHCHIPVSCFTATAKQKVISDIREYFKEKLDINLELYASNSARKNLRYQVIHMDSESDKYATLRWLIEQKDCPTIVYVSKRKRAVKIAQQLCDDGFMALPFHGEMDRNDKQKNQNLFIQDEVQIIVATSAFGMGVDKPNVKLVIHYDISDSLENYVQEAGRAGRDQNLWAECYILFHDLDLDEHFTKLNQSKLSISEIQQVWRAIKDLTRKRMTIQRTTLEIARHAGWDETIYDIDTRVKTAVQALENAGYIKRKNNCPKIFATGILVRNMAEAAIQIDNSVLMDAKEKQNAKRIVSMLISARSIAKGEDEGESRVDYIADRLGLEREEAFKLVNYLREERVISDNQDMTAFIYENDSENRSLNIVKKYAAVEKFLSGQVADEGQYINLKEMNDQAVEQGVKGSTVSMLKTILYYWTIRKYIKKSIEDSSERAVFMPEITMKELWKKREEEISIANEIIHYLYQKAGTRTEDGNQRGVEFSLLELKRNFEEKNQRKITDRDLEGALLYLVKIDAMKLEGGFLVVYSGMTINRLEKDNKIRYKIEDYQTLNEYYMQKIQQIHIVGEFANMMLGNYEEALQFVNEYFQMDYKAFLAKYFKGNRKGEINRNITPEKYNQLFNGLSETQRSIIDDNSQYIVVAAGPGSGKTKVLVHKLASLILLEDIKREQLLMLTFSRAAAMEFSRRLYELIGKAAYYVEIKTFHSYCFDLIGRIGDLSGANTVVDNAIQMIKDDEVEPGKITKTVLVIDEAQDMDAKEFELVKHLIEKNEGLRIIAVGDDDQNIYEFRGSDSKCFQSFLEMDNSVRYELLYNYRSARRIVAYANEFTKYMNNRMKDKPIISQKNEDGLVEFTECISKNLEEPVVNKAINMEAKKSICILTRENVEAQRVVGLLKSRNQKAKLIQSNDNFDLYHLVEIRYFLSKTKKENDSPIIDDKSWIDAKEQLRKIYEKSSNIDLCIRILEVFEELNPRKYRSDFEIYLHESKLEDFYEEDQQTIIVSTLHKSKGREFDTVIMMLNSLTKMEEETKRALYVGMTRARENLYILYNGYLWNSYISRNFPIRKDIAAYQKPEEIMLQLSYRDVVLDFFKDKQHIIRNMYGGIKLFVKQAELYVGYHGQLYPVVMFSKKFKADIEKYRNDGYEIIKAYVRFVLNWKDSTTEKEYLIILPDLYFRCQK